ncbi:MAG TPA: MlaD family protein, partial [Nocardia sp.]
MTQRRTLIGLVLFLVVSFVLSWLVFVTLQRGVEGSTRSYTATFTDVSGLRTGDDVRVAGVRVGRV